MGGIAHLFLQIGAHEEAAAQPTHTVWFEFSKQQEEAERLVKIMRSRVVDSPTNGSAANKLAGTSTPDLSSKDVMEARILHHLSGFSFLKKAHHIQPVANLSLFLRFEEEKSDDK